MAYTVNCIIYKSNVISQVSNLTMIVIASTGGGGGVDVFYIMFVIETILYNSERLYVLLLCFRFQYVYKIRPCSLCINDWFLF